MENIEVLLPILLIAFVVYFIYKKIKESKLVDGLLNIHYKEMGLFDIQVSNLNISEKLKYGVPLNPFFSAYTTTTFGLLNNTNQSYFRKVATTDGEGNEQIKYVEVNYLNSDLDVKEFDVYNY